MKKLKALALTFLIAALTALPAAGKEIVPGGEALAGENKAYIRADGLACYFCAYGLERFFRKSGKVAAYDMDMKKGVVEIKFIKGKSLLTQEELHKIVYDAGYSPRSTVYELVGRVVKKENGYYFILGDTSEEFLLEPSGLPAGEVEKITGQTVKIISEVKKGGSSPMVFKPLELSPIKN